MSMRVSVIAAVTAVVLAALLLGGTATRAAWTDSTDSEVTTLTAGSLSGQISQSGPAPVSLGQVPGVYPQEGSQGLIPGVQGQQWSYVLSNDASSDVAADATLRLQGAPQNTAEYQALRPFLQASVEVEGVSDPLTVPSSGFTNAGFAYDVDLGARLQPGEDVEVTLTLSLPASADGTSNLGVALNNLRSVNSSAHSIFTMTNAAYLRQAGDPS